MTSKRTSAVVGALVAVAMVIGGWSATTTHSAIADAARQASPTLMVGSAQTDAPLAVISSSDNASLTSFARLDRSSGTRTAIDGVFAFTVVGDTTPWQSRPLARVVENAIRTRAARIGPVPGRAPPASAIFI